MRWIAVAVLAALLLAQAWGTPANPGPAPTSRPAPAASGTPGY